MEVQPEIAPSTRIEAAETPGGALVEIVPHLAFVTAQKAFAGVTQVDASLLTGTLYELQHLAELCVGNRERRIVLGPADREDREDAPIFHSFGDQQLLELFEFERPSAR